MTSPLLQTVNDLLARCGQATAGGLLPCPCCKGKAHSLTLENYDEETGEYAPMHAVECIIIGGCGLRTMWHETKSDAIAAWNRRVPDPATLQALAEVVKALEQANEAMNTCFDHVDQQDRTQMQSFDSDKMGAAHLAIRTARALWLPISLAPKDGTWVEVCNDPRLTCYKARFDIVLQAWEDEQGIERNPAHFRSLTTEGQWDSFYKASPAIWHDS